MTESLASPVAHVAAESAARNSYARLLAWLCAQSRDIAAAEDALADAFASALTDWPVRGCPENPEAWLLTVARRKLVDAARHRSIGDGVSRQLQELLKSVDTLVDAIEIPDRRLALLFACAHPAVDSSVRVPLMMQVVLGLDAKRIASAFLVSPTAMGKRLGRAKQKIREAGVPFSIPQRDELQPRLESVLDAIYAGFADAWVDPLGLEQGRLDLAVEALFLARLVSELLPNEAEALSLLACMLYAQARRGARRSGDGHYVPMAEQDTALWDRGMFAEAEVLLRRASTFDNPGRYQLEAALQSAHVERCLGGRNNWTDVLLLYDALVELTASPVVAINRSLAIAEVRGATSALEAMPDVDSDERLANYQPYWATRAELLKRSGAFDAARRAYALAIGLESDEAVRRFLQARLD